MITTTEVKVVVPADLANNVSRYEAEIDRTLQAKNGIAMQTVSDHSPDGRLVNVIVQRYKDGGWDVVAERHDKPGVPGACHNAVYGHYHIHIRKPGTLAEPPQMRNKMDTHAHHTMYEEIAFLDRVLSSIGRGTVEHMIRDVLRPCLEWMGWQLEAHDGGPTTTLERKDAEGLPILNRLVIGPATRTQEADGDTWGAIVAVHVGTRHVEFPVYFKNYADQRNRIDISSRKECGKVEIDRRKADSALPLIPMLASWIKASL